MRTKIVLERMAQRSHQGVCDANHTIKTRRRYRPNVEVTRAILTSDRKQRIHIWTRLDTLTLKRTSAADFCFEVAS